MRQDRLWMYEGRVINGLLSSEFINYVEQFIAFATSHPECMSGGKIKCPCMKFRCRNQNFHELNTVRFHILKNGFVPDYWDWIYHGEQRMVFNVDTTANTFSPNHLIRLMMRTIIHAREWLLILLVQLSIHPSQMSNQTLKHKSSMT